MEVTLRSYGHFLGLVLVDFALSYLSHFELFMVQWKHVIQII